MGGFDRKPGGGTLVQQQSGPSTDLSPGKRTLTAELDGDSPSPATPDASSAPAAPELSDAEVAVLLSEQDEADAIEEARFTSTTGADDDAHDPSLGPRDGIPLASQDHATHWASAQQRVDWVREKFPSARFSSAAERRYYEDVVAHGVAQPQDQDGAQPPTPTPGMQAGARYVWTISFVSPGVLGPMIRERDGWLLQTAPDPSAGYNFDTYLYDSGRGARIPAKALGGTRYRVMMGTAECPGCHFGHGLEVDLYGTNIMEIVGMMAATGAGMLGGGEPIPMESEGAMGPPSGPVAPRPAGPNLRVIQGGGGPPIVPEASPTTAAGPHYATSGNAALQAAPALETTPQTAAAARPQLSLVPEASPLPETAAAPQARPTTGGRRAPGSLPAASPFAATRAASRNKPQDLCPPGSHPVRWPAPIWTTAGCGDSGATSGKNDHPATQTLTRIRPPKRNRSHVRQYLKANAVVMRSLYTRGVQGAIHHKIPLYVSGPDSVDNLVFLPNAHHGKWHEQLARQGATGWMPIDPVGTVYCVL